MPRTGRPSEYEAEEDAVLRNTEGMPPEYVGALMEHLGYRARTGDAYQSRRRLLRSNDRRQPTNDLDRRHQLRRLYRTLQQQLAAIDEEEAFLRERIERDLKRTYDESEDY